MTEKNIRRPLRPKKKKFAQIIIAKGSRTKLRERLEPNTETKGNQFGPRVLREIFKFLLGHN